MSYIKHREKLFQNKTVVRKRSDGNLRKVSSCSDVRAWSLSKDSQRQYFMDCLNAKPSSNIGKYIPPDIIFDIIRKQNTSKLKKFGSLKNCNSEEQLKKRNQPAYKASKLSLHSFKDDKSHTKLELDNLKDMVNDLESKVIIMKKLEEENKELKAQINLNIKKIESVPDIGVFCQNTEISDDKGRQLSNAIDLIRSECSRMKSDVNYLQNKNSILSDKLKRSYSSERTLKNRELSVSLESVNNAMLKRQLSSKDMKVQKLANLYEEQKICIENLVGFVKEMEVAYSWKEEMLLGKLVEFKNLINHNFNKTNNYEARLSLSYEVIKENDILSANFRKVNSALTESVEFYKIRLRGVTCKALEMAGRIEWLLREVAKRDKKISELSKFPGRSSMAIRLTQLDNIVNGDFIYEKNKNKVVETFDRLKKVLKDLKKEALDDHGYQNPFELTEGYSQTNIVQYSDFSSQNSSDSNEMHVQTDYPDEYIIKFLLFNIIIHIFTNIFVKIKSALKFEENNNAKLKEKINKLTNEAKTNEFEILTLKDHNEYLGKRIKSLNHLIDEGNSNKDLVVKKSQCELVAYEYVNSYLDTNFAVSLREYETYCDFLEETLLSNFENFEKKISLKENEVDLLRNEYFCSISELEWKNENLLESLSCENRLNKILMNEIEKLNFDLKERDDVIDVLIKNVEFYKNINRIKINNKSSSTQVWISVRDVELMTGKESYQLTNITSDKETQLVLQSPVKIVKSVSKNNLIADTMLRRKIIQVKLRVKKIKGRISYFRNKLELAVEFLTKLRDANVQLSSINKKVIFDNNKLKENLSNMREGMGSLKREMDSEALKNKELMIYQMKILNDFKKIQNELQEVKKIKNKSYSSSSINTDVLMYDYDQALLSKDECINQLKNRIEKLIELLKEIEKEKKIKEENYVENCTQCDIDEETQEKYLILINNVKEEYEETISNLKRQNSDEMDSKEKYFRNNLALLKETYERDIKRIKVANADSLRKIQSFHEDEIKALKLSQQDSKVEIDLESIHEKHCLEIENMKATYEKVMKEKADAFASEKDSLQKELKRYMDEKEQQVEDITKKMEEGMKNMKKKCKVQMKKMRKASKEALEQLRKEYNSKNEDYLSIDMSDLGQSSVGKEYSLESIDNLTRKDELEAKTTTSGIEDDIFESSFSDERRYLLSRIQQLEEQLNEKQKQSSENACDSEKRVWIERERCREIGKLLDKELERNEKLKNKLKEEKERYDQLLTINKSLINKVQVLDSNKSRDFEIIDKVDNRISYGDLFDCFETHIDDNYETNFKYI